MSLSLSTLGALLLLLAIGIGSVLAALAGLLCLGAVSLSWWRRSHRRVRVAERDFGSREWSSSELSTLAAYATSSHVGRPAPQPDHPTDPCPTASVGRQRLLDRWSWTQVLWAGVMGWLYNELSDLAARLVAGSSYGALRQPLIALLHRLLGYLSSRGIRRTIATSALVTASTTGLLGSAFGAGNASASVAPTAVTNAVLTAAISYTVQPGDTLSAIAQRFGTTVDALAAANSIADPNLIYAGQVLTIASVASPAPPPAVIPSVGGSTTYTVEPGDTLSAIAQLFGTTVDALAAANSIADPNLIYAGQVLTIASVASPAPPPAPAPAVIPSAGGSTTYTVEPGDTLSAIAQLFGTTVDALAAANSIADPNLIYAGQVLIIASATSVAPASTPAPAPAPAPSSPPAPSGIGTYENPLRAISGLTPERIDQGVDYAGAGPIYAIGDGVVLNTTNAGWPGGAFISYQLADGPAAGDIVYVAEKVEPAVQVGQQVGATTVLGTLVDAYPNLETGWAAAPGNGDSAASAAGQWSSTADADSLPTAYGENFSQLLAALGAPPGVSDGAVQGSLPADWPSW